MPLAELASVHQMLPSGPVVMYRGADGPPGFASNSVIVTAAAGTAGTIESARTTARIKLLPVFMPVRQCIDRDHPVPEASAQQGHPYTFAFPHRSVVG